MSDLRTAYQSHVGNNPPPNRVGCPTADELNALAASNQIGESPAQVVLLEHVLTCAACRPEFELLRATHAAEKGERRAKSSVFSPQRIGFAAMLLLAAGIGVEARRRSQPSVTRGESIDASELVLVSPVVGTMRPLSGKFVWHAVNGAVAYQVEVLDSSGTAVVQATTADTILQLSAPDSVRVAALPTFDWMVTARRADGNERRSALMRVRIATAEKR